MTKNSVFVRTDKNGTEIYHDYTCPRCGGAGGADNWIYTGWTCYSCGGTGKADKPRVFKKYTPEYQAKLDAMRARRAEKARAKRVEELKNKLPEMLKAEGFNADGKVYLVTGDSYSIKEELKQAGARWIQRLYSWTFTELSTEYPSVEISWEEVIEPNYEEGYLGWKDIDVAELIKSKLPKEEMVVSEHVGEIGKRLELEATLDNWFSFEVPSYSGWGTTTKVLYKFRDTAGNILVWATTGYGLDENIGKGDKVILRGTVAKHSEYKGDKQTELKRCNVKKVEEQ